MSFTRDPAAQRRILNRLRRAQGQLAALIAAVEAESPCRQTVTQLAAVTSALDKAGFAMVAAAMQNCISEEGNDPAEAAAAGAGSVATDEHLTLDELEKLFLSLA